MPACLKQKGAADLESVAGLILRCAQVLGCSKCVSAVAILDYSGTEDLCARFAALAERARAAWRPGAAEPSAACGALPCGLPAPVRGNDMSLFMFGLNRTPKIQHASSPGWCRRRRALAA